MEQTWGTLTSPDIAARKKVTEVLVDAN